MVTSLMRRISALIHACVLTNNLNIYNGLVLPVRPHSSRMIERSHLLAITSIIHQEICVNSSNIFDMPTCVRRHIKRTFRLWNNSAFLFSRLTLGTKP